jgi:hypothetical protein
MDTVEVPDQMPANAMPEGVRPTAMVRNPAAGAMTHTALPERGRGRRAFKRFLLFVLILVGTGLGVLLWVDPGFRDRAMQWTKSTYARAHRYATGADDKPVTGSNPAASSSDEIPDPPVLKRKPAPLPPAPPDEVQPRQKLPPATADSAVEKPEPVKETPPPPAPPAPKSEPVAKKPAPEKSPPAVVPNPEERMVQIRSASYEASRKGDYKSALKLWEQMGDLPEQYRDKLYEIRLNNLREQLKKSGK